MKNWAIVVGINYYEHLQQDKHLRCAVQDAESVKAFLCKSAGFSDNNVLLCTDESSPLGSISTQPTLTNLRRILREEIQQADGADDFWFFFAGHGIGRNSQDYFLPRDGNPYDEGSAISVQFVIECLSRCRAKNIVLILDMCREEKPQSPGSRGATVVGQETIRLTQQKSLISIFSCNPSEESYEIAELRQGAFTYVFLNALRQNLTLREIEQYLIREVPTLNQKYKKPAQVPRVIPSPGWKYDYPLFRTNNEPISVNVEQPNQKSPINEFNYAEVTLSRNNEGNNDTWILRVDTSGTSNAIKKIHIKKGEAVKFELPSNYDYTMSLQYVRTTYYTNVTSVGNYQVASGPRLSREEVIEISDKWSGNFTAGKHNFECGPKLNVVYFLGIRRRAYLRQVSLP